MIKLSKNTVPCVSMPLVYRTYDLIVIPVEGLFFDTAIPLEVGSPRLPVPKRAASEHCAPFCFVHLHYF
jgi:hypothetical protein